MDYQQLENLFKLAEAILILRGGATSGNWAHDGRPGKLGGSTTGGGFERISLKKGTTSRPDVVTISKRFRKGRDSRKGNVPRPKPKPKPQPVKLQPGDGPKVTGALNLSKVPKRGKAGPPVRDALEIIDSIHSDGDLRNTPLVVDSTTRYHGALHRFGPVPAKITVSRKGPHIEMTTAHEVGHFLDLEAIGRRGKFSSESGAFEGRGNRGKRLEGVQQKRRALQAAISESAASKALRRDVPNQEVEVTYTVGGKSRSYKYKADKGYAEYLRDPKEQFARAYSQYITTKSGNPKMLKQLSDAVNRGKGKNKINYHEQWGENDFKPISKAFDDLFLELGWLK